MFINQQCMSNEGDMHVAFYFAVIADRPFSWFAQHKGRTIRDFIRMWQGR